jgi:hypothetical protein
MTIPEIVQLLEDTINQRMTEFEKLGKAMSQLLRKKRLTDNEKQCIISIRIGMAGIVKELQPVKSLVLEENPSFGSIFTELIAFYDDYNANNGLNTSQRTASQIDNNRTTQGRA